MCALHSLHCDFLSIKGWSLSVGFKLSYVCLLLAVLLNKVKLLLDATSSFALVKRRVLRCLTDSICVVNVLLRHSCDHFGSLVLPRVVILCRTFLLMVLYVFCFV